MRAVKVTYNAEDDTLRITLSDSAVDESDENKPGVIPDYDAEGSVTGIELLDAS